MTTQLSDAELGWAAGAIDGEGCIHIQVVKHKNSALPQYALVLSVANCDPRMPRRMKSMFGGNVIKREATFRRRPLYEWRITSAQAGGALEAIRPYMVIKGEQADIFIEFAKTLKRTGGHTKEVRQRRANLHRRIADLKVMPLDEETA